MDGLRLLTGHLVCPAIVNDGGVRRPTRRRAMKQREETREKAKWTFQALGIVLAYFGAFGVLMYPVLDAAGYLA
jgi:hypothetical protein